MWIIMFPHRWSDSGGRISSHPCKNTNWVFTDVCFCRRIITTSTQSVTAPGLDGGSPSLSVQVPVLTFHLPREEQTAVGTACVCERVRLHDSMNHLFCFCLSLLLSSRDVFRDDHSVVHAVRGRLLFAGQRPPFWPMGRHPCRFYQPVQLLRPWSKWRGRPSLQQVTNTQPFLHVQDSSTQDLWKIKICTFVVVPF